MSKKTEAKCNGAMLTVGFHSASPPLIWRFDLERNHSFTLALQGEDADWELGVTSPKGDFYPVVHFATPEDAEEAFAKVEKALSVKKAASSIVTRSLAVLAVAIIVVIGGFAGFGFYVDHHIGGASSPVTPMSAAPSPQTRGVPMSADDILKVPN